MPHMQLNLFDDIYELQNEGFTITKTFDSSSTNNKFEKLESTFSVLLNGNIILYVQDNKDGTFNAFGYHYSRFNVDLREVIKIAKNKNNWCLQD